MRSWRVLDQTRLPSRPLPLRCLAPAPLFVTWHSKGRLTALWSANEDYAPETASQEQWADVPEPVEYLEYVGPVASRAAMEFGCKVANLGLEISIGPRFLSAAMAQHSALFACVSQTSYLTNALICANRSQVAPGRGLFVAVDSDEDVDRVEIPEGTLISGYSKVGAWASRWEGDKAVSCTFSKVLSILNFIS